MPRALSLTLVSAFTLLAVLGAMPLIVPGFPTLTSTLCTLAAGVISCSSSNATVTGDLAVTGAISEGTPAQTLATKYQLAITNGCSAGQYATGVSGKSLVCSSVSGGGGGGIPLPAGPCSTTEVLSYVDVSGSLTLACVPTIGSLTAVDITNLLGGGGGGGGTTMLMGNGASMSLPAPGPYTVLVWGTYQTCVDTATSLRLDGSNIKTYSGVGFDSEGCDQNAIMAMRTNVAAGAHTWSFSRGSQTDFNWIAIQ